MRQIKFRGRTLPVDGKALVYGFYVHNTHTEPGGKGMFEVHGIFEEKPDINKWWRIQPDTLAQFCGYDKHGYEVYEGDILIDDNGQEHIAEIYDRPQILGRLARKDCPYD